MDPTEEKIPGKGKKKKTTFSRWIIRFFLAFFLCIFLISLLLQFHFFQNITADWAANRLSKKMGVELTIDRVNFSISKGFVLGDLMIRDAENDTMLYSKSLSSTLNKSLVSAFNNKIDVNSIRLEGAFLKLRYKPGETRSELEKAIFGNPDSGEQKNMGASPDIDMEQLFLEDIRIHIVDERAGKMQDIILREGYVQIDEVDFINGRIYLEQVHLTSPEMKEAVLTAPRETLDTVSISQPLSSPNRGHPKPFELVICDLIIDNGRLDHYYEAFRHSQSLQFQSNHFLLDGLEMSVRDIRYEKDSVLLAQSLQLKARLNESFSIRNISFDSLFADKESLDIVDLQLATDKSSLNQNLTLNFKNVDDFTRDLNEILVDADLSTLDLSLTDLSYFVPSINNSPIVRRINGDMIKLKGKLSGSLAELRGANLDLSLGRSTRFRGDIFTRNLNVQDREMFNLEVDLLQTSIPYLRRLIPGFNLPEKYDQLGSIQFAGRLDGYLLDFVTFGHVKTELGDADLDMRLDLKEGSQNANYSGLIDLINFDLGKWTNDPEMGKINLTAHVENGRGFSDENATATLNGTIHSFLYKGYSYENVLLNGTMDKHRFTGDVQINDENVDFNFTGQVELVDSIANYRFQADVRNLDLMAINLMDKPFRLTGDLDIDMRGSNLDEVTGNAIAHDLEIYTNGKRYAMDSIYLESDKLNEQDMGFSLKSEIGDASIKGIFDLREVPGLFGRILKKNYPYHTRNLQIAEVDSLTQIQNFDFNLNIKDTRNFLEIVGVKNLRIADTQLSGKVDNSLDIFEFELSSPFLAYDKYKMIKFNAVGSSNQTSGNVNITIDSTYLDAKILKPIEIVTYFSGDSIHYDVSTTDVLDSLQKIALRGFLVPNVNGYDIKVENNELIMLGTSWDFHPDNKITLGPHYIDIQNLSITDANRTIEVEDINRSGIGVKFRQFDFHLFNSILRYDKMIFSGLADGDLKIRNLFGDNVLSGSIVVQDLRINDDPFGTMNVQMNEIQDDWLDLGIAIEKDEQRLLLDGVLDLQNNFLSANLDIMNYPMSIFEYIITDGISDTRGAADIHAFVEGPLSDLILRGDALVKEGGVKIDYLGSYYLLDDQPIIISEDYIDLSQTVLKDMNGNTATMTGGLRHNMFADFRLDLNISSDKFIALNTTKFDNPLYYGFGQGNISVDFSGAFDAADLRVNAITGEQTYLSIPISSAQYGFDESFIRFYKKDSTEESLSFEEEFKLLGIDFEMNLEITEEATVAIIFDDRVGEIMQGNGRGDVSLFIKRYGDFDVYGSYEIESGEYLFTAYGIIAKPFELNRGGILSWNGDPFDASLNVQAEYKGLRAPLNVFLAEYLATSPNQVDQESKNRTDVDLQLILGGTLFNPIVNFDISFPELTGELKSYADSKMRTLKATDNGINDQVFGLLVFKNFLPYDNPMSNLSGNSILLTGSSTLTEFFTSQLSLLLTDVIQQQLGDDSFIQGIDLEIGLNENTNIFADQAQNLNLTPDEVDVNSRYRFKNEDFILNTGLNYVWESPLGVGNYLVGDIQLEWFITEDRRLKFKFYGRYDYDEAFASRKYKNGFGISFRKEFGSLGGLKEAIQKSIDEAKKNAAVLDEDE